MLLLNVCCLLPDGTRPPAGHHFLVIDHKWLVEKFLRSNFFFYSRTGLSKFVLALLVSVCVGGGLPLFY